MKKTRIKEAQYTLSVDGLNSADAETLSRILSLAGQAETGGTSIGTPMDADLGLGSSNALMPGDDALGADLMTGTPELGMDDFDEIPSEDQMDDGIPGELGSDPIEAPLDTMDSSIDDLPPEDDDFEINQEVMEEDYLEADDATKDTEEIDEEIDEEIERVCRSAGVKENSTSRYPWLDSDRRPGANMGKDVDMDNPEEVARHPHEPFDVDGDGKHTHADHDRKETQSKEFNMREFIDSLAEEDDGDDEGHKNIIVQLRKVLSLRNNPPKVRFNNGETVDVDAKTAERALAKFNSFQKPNDKREFMDQISQSPKALMTLEESGDDNGIVWFDISEMTSEDLFYLDNMSTARGQAGLNLEYGEEFDKPEYVMGSSDPEIISWLETRAKPFTPVREEESSGIDFQNRSNEHQYDLEGMRHQSGGDSGEQRYTHAKSGNNPLKTPDELNEDSYIKLSEEFERFKKDNA